MNVAIILALIGAGITVFGWFFTMNRDRRQRKLDEEIKFTTCQIEQLYAPLSALLLDSQSTYKELLWELGIPCDNGDLARLPDENDLFGEYSCQINMHLDVWLFWIENDFFPRNEEIKKLIVSNIHLIDEKDIPQPFLDFLAHYSSWKVKHERWKRENVKYNWHSNTPFPQDFRIDVIKKLKALKEQHTRLLGEAQISIPQKVEEPNKK